MKRWIERTRTGLAYWRDIETILPLPLTLTAILLAGAAVIAWFGGLPWWVVAAAILLVWLIGGSALILWVSYRQWQTAQRRRSQRTPVHDPSRYREFGGVLWHLQRSGVNDRAWADGPLCPEDRATLSFQETRYSNTDIRKVQEDDFPNGALGYMVCPTCRKRYSLQRHGSRTDQARSRARRRRV